MGGINIIIYSVYAPSVVLVQLFIHFYWAHKSQDNTNFHLLKWLLNKKKQKLKINRETPVAKFV